MNETDRQALEAGRFRAAGAPSVSRETLGACAIGMAALPKQVLTVLGVTPSMHVDIGYREQIR